MYGNCEYRRTTTKREQGKQLGNKYCRRDSALHWLRQVGGRKRVVDSGKAGSEKKEEKEMMERAREGGADKLRKVWGRNETGEGHVLVRNMDNEVMYANKAIVVWARKRV